LGKDLVFKKKWLSPNRVKGFTGLVAAAGLYTYLPVIAAFTGVTIPKLAALVSLLYGGS
jgi:hypothetical protein